MTDVPDHVAVEVRELAGTHFGARALAELLGTWPPVYDRIAERVLGALARGELEYVTGASGGFSGFVGFGGDAASPRPLATLAEETLQADVESPAPSTTQSVAQSAATTPASAAQAEVLRAAASSATPFCEVCDQRPATGKLEGVGITSEERPSPASKAAPRRDTKGSFGNEAAQVAVLTAAANASSPFCEVCK